MREETLIAFYIWAGEAAPLIEEANLTKEDYRDAEYGEGVDEVFRDRFSNTSSDNTN
ncbi:hypothetical protein NDI85_17710 [Halomicroarcula sp. S1AR25-4]|uniref:hypothetical protein n=1 Tax=Haloarcula sp. S1AR25-4 TaxID=2950538 RepID=UPI002874988E|nr:hypothetical protein [Halomicroarcula sp. S1AR25-4]MDS0279635.1 hypothetical protein [Halomicroarcula sp. S1AR25-4]